MIIFKWVTLFPFDNCGPKKCTSVKLEFCYFQEGVSVASKWEVVRERRGFLLEYLLGILILVGIYKGVDLIFNRKIGVLALFGYQKIFELMYILLIFLLFSLTFHTSRW